MYPGELSAKLLSAQRLGSPKQPGDYRNPATVAGMADNGVSDKSDDPLLRGQGSRKTKIPADVPLPLQKRAPSRFPPCILCPLRRATQSALRHAARALAWKILAADFSDRAPSRFALRSLRQIPRAASAKAAP